MPLSAVAKLSRSVGPLTVNHLGQLPAVTDLVQPEARRRAGRRRRPRSRSSQRELNLPATLSATFQGTAQAFQQSLKGLGLLLLAAVLVIYLILGILYESFIHPLTILSGLPSAGVGALLTLVLFHQELNLYGFVGIIMLIGIVKKNAIMMIDFALEAQRAGRPAAEAIYQGCLLRFRPIMMTTMAALMGTLPIAVGVRRRLRRPPLARPGRRRRPPALPAPDALHHAGHLSLPRRFPRACRPLATHPPARDTRRATAG